MLNVIRDVRKVAWILLSGASVESVDGGVLTLAFAREGDAKGFSTSGCDQDLAGVLDRIFGVRPVIKASVQTGAPIARTEVHDQGGGRPAGPRPEAEPERAKPEDPEPEDLTPARARPASQAPDDSSSQARSDSQVRDRPRPESKSRPVDDDPRWMTDPGAPGVADEVTGTDLILRELGGRIIEETDED